MTDFPPVENAEQYLGNVEEGANDLDILSEKLLHHVEAMQSVARMSEPVRSDAIAIARDILNKLKLKFGDRNIHEGLDIQSAEDVSILNAITIVGELFEHLLAWGRGIDASIMNDPSIQGTINAMGQVAFMAKMEALRLAKKSRDMFLADSIRQRIAMVNAKFKAPSAKTFGELLDTISRGLDRVLTRMPNVGVAGVAVAHAMGHDRSNFMGAAPTAGLSQQLGSEATAQHDAIGKINTEMLRAQASSKQAEAARVASQNAARARQQGTPPASTPARSGTGRQAVQQARTQQQQRSAPSNQTQMQNRNNMLQANLRHQHEEEERHHHHEMEVQRIARETAARKAAQAAAQKIAAQTAAKQVAAKIDPNMLKGFDMKGVTGAQVSTTSADMVKQMAAQAAKNATAGNLKPPVTPPPPVPDPNNPPYAPLHPQGKGVGR